MSKIQDDIESLVKLYLDKMGSTNDRMIDYAFKRGTIKLLSIIAMELARLNEKTPDET
jgi:hypothetical protein